METTIKIDVDREVRIWHTGTMLHLGEYRANGKGGFEAGHVLTVPIGRVDDLVQSIIKAK